MAQPIRLDLRAGSRQLDAVWERSVVDGAAPYDFTGHTARMQVRLFPGAPGTPLLDLVTVNSATQGIRWFKATAGGILDGMRIVISEASLQALPGLHAPEIGAEQRFVHDILITPPSGPERRVFFGDLIIAPGVTA